MKSPVSLIFFNRPETLELVFEKVKLAQPPKLFLIQDGPRDDHPDDRSNIEKCRSIVENIDWPCEVYKNYSPVNMGCGMRPQSGISWVLSQVESTVILEDDCVPEMTFFEYCDELLEKYKDDDRIAYISGLNHFEDWDFGGNSYGFTKSGAIWGWATWQRAWSNYDYSVGLIEDEYVSDCLKDNFPFETERIKLWKKTNEKVKNGVNISYWDVQWGLVKYTQNQLVIVPEYNLISNIGVGVKSTHATMSSSLHKKYRDYNNMPVKALEFPLKHPKAVIRDAEYDRLVAECNKKAQNRMRIIALKNRIQKIFRRKSK